VSTKLCSDRRRCGAASRKTQMAPEQATTDSSTPFADLLSVENRQLDAKIKGICRGC
jgi:hypothetical protein